MSLSAYLHHLQTLFSDSSLQLITGSFLLTAVLLRMHYSSKACLPEASVGHLEALYFQWYHKINYVA